MDLQKKKIRLLTELRKMGIQDERVLSAIEEVPREIFVPEDIREYAYSNKALPIMKGQTISQPYTVAFMIELLDLKEDARVLEIGAGSGYNAAIMAYITKKGKVYSLEIDEHLSEVARMHESAAGIENIIIINRDGFHGYKEKAPYDRIIFTAGIDQIPIPVQQQMRNGGIIVAPLNTSLGQTMTKFTKTRDGWLTSDHGLFSFVPFRRKR